MVRVYIDGKYFCRRNHGEVMIKVISSGLLLSPEFYIFAIKIERRGSEMRRVPQRDIGIVV